MLFLAILGAGHLVDGGASSIGYSATPILKSWGRSRASSVILFAQSDPCDISSHPASIAAGKGPYGCNSRLPSTENFTGVAVASIQGLSSHPPTNGSCLFLPPSIVNK